MPVEAWVSAIIFSDLQRHCKEGVRTVNFAVGNESFWGGKPNGRVLKERKCCHFLTANRRE
jgi:hypothetical protein